MSIIAETIVRLNHQSGRWPLPETTNPASVGLEILKIIERKKMDVNDDLKNLLSATERVVGGLVDQACHAKQNKKVPSTLKEEIIVQSVEALKGIRSDCEKLPDPQSGLILSLLWKTDNKHAIQDIIKRLSTVEEFLTLSASESKSGSTSNGSSSDSGQSMTQSYKPRGINHSSDEPRIEVSPGRISVTGNGVRVANCGNTRETHFITPNVARASTRTPQEPRRQWMDEQQTLPPYRDNM